MRKFIIDTDTGADDAVGLMIALCEPGVEVVAVTTVYGNVSLEKATRNALIAIERAGTYKPPVYIGCSRPLMRYFNRTTVGVHGRDGLGDQGYPDAAQRPEAEHGVDALIRYAGEIDDLEIIALGPLTNLAAAIVRDPAAMARCKKITLMGGAMLTTNQATPAAEYNIYTDAEAADIVWRFSVPIAVCPIDLCWGEIEFQAGEIDRIANAGTARGDFLVGANTTLRRYMASHFGRDVIDMPDPTTVAAALYPEMIKTATPCYSYVDVKGNHTYGQTVFDTMDILKRPKNATLVSELYADMFKNKIYEIMGA